MAVYNPFEIERMKESYQQGFNAGKAAATEKWCDQLAKAAMQGLLSASWYANEPVALAMESYKMADAMIAEGKKERKDA